MLPYTEKQLFDHFVELDVIDKKSLENSLEESRTTKTPLHKILLKRELISDENLGKVLSDLQGTKFVDLTRTTIPKETLKIIPEIVAKKQKIIAYEQDKNGLKVAMFNPQNKEITDFITKKTGTPVTAFFTTERNIEEALAMYSEGLQQAFDKLLKKNIEEAEKNKGGDAPIAKIVDTLINYAYQNKASDIHIEPEEDKSFVRFRVDGVLHDVLTLSKEMHNPVITRIKVLSKLRTDEHMSAQDGKLRLSLEMEELDIRISIVPIVGGEKCVMRLLSSRSRQFSLSDLGMSAKDIAKVRNAYQKPHGMLLSTGPTGSGKTTSIYAILKILNTRDINIATIEDPVEYDIDGINQIQANPKTNLTFAHGLRAILRQDPDVIFVGEIRDNETAGIATNSAMTGHLVLSTLHTNDAATTLPRLIDMDIEPFLVASTVNVIIAQRLVRMICQDCKVSYTVSKDELPEEIKSHNLEKHFGVSEENNIRLYKGKGCEVCHDTGYAGRIGVFEILEITPAIRELITAKEDSDTIQKKALEEGMSTMMEDGLEKVSKGVTTIEEVLRVAKA